MESRIPQGWGHPRSATCGMVGEHALIEWIATLVPSPSDEVRIGIGDDAAVVAPRRNHVDVLTTDVQVDGVHFTRALSRAADVGHRALHVNLSDIAAMGAMPRIALLSLGLPADLDALWVAQMVEGLVDAARATRVQLVGGNVSRSPVLFVDVTVSGVAKPRQVLRRAGARAGDELYVSGTAGTAAAGLAWLTHARADAARDAGDEPVVSEALSDAIARYRRPEARIALGVQVARNRAASACMDTSDGLADALRQLATASGVGVRVEAASVPVSPAVADVAAMTGNAADAMIWSGGEDYELVFAVPRRMRRRFLHAASRKGLPPVTRIGVCTKDADLLIVHADQQETPLPGGYVHFADAQETESCS